MSFLLKLMDAFDYSGFLTLLQHTVRQDSFSSPKHRFMENIPDSASFPGLHVYSQVPSTLSQTCSIHFFPDSLLLLLLLHSGYAYLLSVLFSFLVGFFNCSLSSTTLRTHTVRRIHCSQRLPSASSHSLIKAPSEQNT